MRKACVAAADQYDRGVAERTGRLPFAGPADAEYADIRHALEQEGKPIGPNDLLIAAHARAVGTVLVTANAKEFGRVRDLKVENWLA